MPLIGGSIVIIVVVAVTVVIRVARAKGTSFPDAEERANMFREDNKRDS